VNNNLIKLSEIVHKRSNTQDMFILKLIAKIEELHTKIQPLIHAENVPEEWFARVHYGGYSYDPFLDTYKNTWKHITKEASFDYTIAYLERIMKKVLAESPTIDVHPEFFMREKKDKGEIITIVFIKEKSYIRIYIKDIQEFIRLSGIDISVLEFTHVDYFLSMSFDKEAQTFKDIENLIEYITTEPIEDNFTRKVLECLNFQPQKVKIINIAN